MHTFPPFEPGNCYHLYNHAIAEENLFREPDNYRYFLDKYIQHAGPIVSTYAYCLMPNHFHFLIRIKSYNLLKAFFEFKRPGTFDSKPIGHQLGNWLNAYASAFNKRYSRRGKLFLQQFKRLTVTNETYFQKLVAYIHCNPVHHGFTDHPGEWDFSSYADYLGTPAAFLSSQVVINSFGGKKEFLEAHRSASDLSDFKNPIDLDAAVFPNATLKTKNDEQAPRLSLSPDHDGWLRGHTPSPPRSPLSNPSLSQDSQQSLTRRCIPSHAYAAYR